MRETDPVVAEAERQIETAAREQALVLAEEGALLTGWVLVTDWLMPDNERQLNRFEPAEMPPWIRDGLLQGALDLEDDLDDLADGDDE